MKVYSEPVTEINVHIVLSKKQASILREILGDCVPVDVRKLYQEQTGLDATTEEVRGVVDLYDTMGVVLRKG